MGKWAAVGTVPGFGRQAPKFLVVGAAAYLTEVALFNALLILSLPYGEGGKPVLAKTVAAVAAAAVGYLGNRHWAFRQPQGHRHPTGRQLLLFAAVNLAAAAAAVACLAASRYLLGFDSILADNISGNIIGTGIGMVIRFTAYRRWVFPAANPAAAR